MSDINEKPEINPQRELRILREYVHLLADAMDKSPMPFVAGYPDGRTMAFNEAFAKLTGYTEEELRSMQWVLYLTPTEWQDREAQAMEELGRTGQPQFYEKEYANKNGSRTPVGVTLGQTNDKEGKVQYYYALVSDLSEKKRAERLEKEVQDIKERNQLMVSTAFEGLAIVEDGKIVEVNDAYAQMTGYEPSELVGMPLASLVVPGLRGLVSPQLSGAAEGTFEVMLNGKDGRTLTVEIISRDIMYKGVEVRMDRVKDISERKKAQADKELLLKQLAEAREELSDLTQVATVAVNVAQPEMAMDGLLRNLAAITKADSGMAMTCNGEQLIVRAAFGFGERRMAIDYVDVDSVTDLFPRSVVAENRPLYVEDAQAGPDVSAELRARGARTLLGVPIRYGTDIIGVLHVEWNAPRARNERDIRLLEIMADRCASAIIAANMNAHSKATEDIGNALSEINSELSSALNLSGFNPR
jgi:PAS domain S-box-containing protein